MGVQGDGEAFESAERGRWKGGCGTECATAQDFRRLFGSVPAGTNSTFVWHHKPRYQLSRTKGCSVAVDSSQVLIDGTREADEVFDTDDDSWADATIEHFGCEMDWLMQLKGDSTRRQQIIRLVRNTANHLGVPANVLFAGIEGIYTPGLG